jgi:hypothetical protein
MSRKRVHRCLSRGNDNVMPLGWLAPKGASREKFAPLIRLTLGEVVLNVSGKLDEAG